METFKVKTTHEFNGKELEVVLEATYQRPDRSVGLMHGYVEDLRMLHNGEEIELNDWDMLVYGDIWLEGYFDHLQSMEEEYV